ncbi:MAG: hypothetical protein FWD05_09775 [Oscillospiraceae bacterium]|nr:hypothetical protein [Oscillospiraceae bacterium]
MPLPKGFQNKKVEVIVLLQADAKTLPVSSGLNMTTLMKGSITESLIGIIPKTDPEADKSK